MTVNLTNVLALIQFVTALVDAIGDAKGNKQAIIVQAVKDLLPLVEGVSGKDLLDNALLETALDRYVRAMAEVAVAKAAFVALVNDTKDR